jgi:formiminotetrahydrofolate cyclodeaminase
MTDKLNKEKDTYHSKDDSKKEIRLTRLKRLEKKLKSNILKRKKAINKNG